MDKTYIAIHGLEFCWTCHDYHLPNKTGLEHLEGLGIRVEEYEAYFGKERKDTK